MDVNSSNDCAKTIGKLWNFWNECTNLNILVLVIMILQYTWIYTWIRIIPHFNQNYYTPYILKKTISGEQHYTGQAIINYTIVYIQHSSPICPEHFNSLLAIIRELQFVPQRRRDICSVCGRVPKCIVCN